MSTVVVTYRKKERTDGRKDGRKKRNEGSEEGRGIKEETCGWEKKNTPRGKGDGKKKP
jgi:hypothetical protein